MGTKVERLLILINTIILISLFSVCFSPLNVSHHQRNLVKDNTGKHKLQFLNEAVY